MKENAYKIVFPTKARVEIVTLTTNINNVLCAKDFFDCDKLKCLLTEHPLLIALVDQVGSCSNSLCESITSLCMEMIVKLRELHVTYNKGGGFLPSWQAYQLECALEEMFLGKTLSQYSKPYSKVLVPRTKGFLSLAPSNAAASSETSLPELSIWTNNHENKTRILRLSRASNYLKSNPATLGNSAVANFQKRPRNGSNPNPR